MSKLFKSQVSVAITNKGHNLVPAPKPQSLSFFTKTQIQVKLQSTPANKPPPITSRSSCPKNRCPDGTQWFESLSFWRR